MRLAEHRRIRRRRVRPRPRPRPAPLRRRCSASRFWASNLLAARQGLQLLYRSPHRLRLARVHELANAMTVRETLNDMYERNALHPVAAGSCAPRAAASLRVPPPPERCVQSSLHPPLPPQPLPLLALPPHRVRHVIVIVVSSDGDGRNCGAVQLARGGRRWQRRRRRRSPRRRGV